MGSWCRALVALVLALVLPGCGEDRTRIEVDVKPGSCKPSCALGQAIRLAAYRTGASPCLIASKTTLASEGAASLEELPIVEGESFSVGVVTSCVENPLCAVCWDARGLSATWARHELTLKSASGCVPGDPTLALLTALPRTCP